jgi:5-methylcytosine-specific restriction endonuclease McrA
MAWTNGGPSRTTTPQHREWRRGVLDRDQRVCQLQYPGRCTQVATQADHIIEIADGGSPFDLGNGQAVCEPCHKLKTSLHANKTRWSDRSSTTHPDETHPALR